MVNALLSQLFLECVAGLNDRKGCMFTNDMKLTRQNMKYFVHIVCNEIQVKVNLEITTFFFYLRFPYCPNFFWFGVVIHSSKLKHLLKTVLKLFVYFWWQTPVFLTDLQMKIDSLPAEDIIISPVTAVIKSALRSQTLHYRKDEMKTTSSFSENGRFFSKIHSYKKRCAAFLFWSMQCSCFNKV